MKEVLKINGLSKNYGPIQALRGLDLNVNEGEVWGILGPNGSGKTTTLGIILGILKSNQGQYEWFSGTYGDQYRIKIGAILETPNFYPYLNAIENLKIIQHIKNSHDDHLDELLRMVKLSGRKKSAFTTYSLGMKQRLAIAATLIGNPEVLIFDEPTNGLDPQGIVDIRNTLIEIAGTGKTVIMASHILDEVEKICSHVAILRRGHLLKSGQVGNILSDNVIIEIGTRLLDMPKLKELIQSVAGVKTIEEKNGMYELEVSPEVEAEYLNQLAFKSGIVLDRLQMKKMRLETEFLELLKNAPK